MKCARVAYMPVLDRPAHCHMATAPSLLAEVAEAVEAAAAAGSTAVEDTGQAAGRTAPEPGAGGMSPGTGCDLGWGSRAAGSLPGGIGPEEDRRQQEEGIGRPVTADTGPCAEAG